MSVAAQLPGASFSTAAPKPDAASLRSDVAGFAGRTRRGPIAQRVRVEGWNDYLRWFGGLDTQAYGPYCLRGYFDNGGEVAHVVRVGDNDTLVNAAHTAFAELPPFGPYGGYRIEASSPGAWANRTRLRLRYRRDGASGRAELDLSVETVGEPVEYLAGLPIGQRDDDGGDALEREVARRSVLVRMVAGAPASVPASAPRWLDWQLLLNGGADSASLSDAAYSAALQQLADEPEVALLCVPDLHRDLAPEAARDLLAAMLEPLDALRDRLLLIDAPAASVVSTSVPDWIGGVRGVPPAAAARSAAAYHPWLKVADPLGGSASPLKNVPPSGHVAGVISRLDRERGPHHTPANAALRDALDLATLLNGDEAIALNAGAVNLLRCRAGDGLQVWGGSTLARSAPADGAAPRTFTADHFIAYRRLIHRLVRAIRRVAEPLVFDVNGPQLWLSFVRAVNTVLLEAWRGGALKGERPAEAFQVRCDEANNPPQSRDLGLCVCDISVAPVAPMEFIVFRMALNGDGTLEVFES